MVLTATPAAGSAFTGWGGSCGTELTCTVPLGVSPSTVTASFALIGDGSIDIAFAGSATGEVLVDTGSAQATCFSSCSVPVQAGDNVTIYAATPSDFTGWGGACSGTSNEGWCFVPTVPAGSTPVTVTFDHDPKQLWTRLPFANEPVVAAAFDGSDDVVALTSEHLIKLDPSGSTLWMRSIVGRCIATGADDSIYIATSSALVKLDAGGTTLWSTPLDANSGGSAGGYGFLHCIAASGSHVAVHGTNGVAMYADTGALVWSVPVTGSLSPGVAIESTGIVDAGVLPEDTGDGMDALRLAASDGSVVGRVDNANVNYHGLIAVDAADHLVGSSAGHSHVCIRESTLAGAFDWTTCIDEPVASYVDNGLAIAGTGDIAWLHFDTDTPRPARFTLARLAATGSETWALHRHATGGYLGTPLGTNVLDVAAGPTGRFAIVGEYVGFTYDGAWIQVFSP